MRTLPFEDCVIRIAELLGVTELEVIEVLKSEFEGRSPEGDGELEEAYWTFFE